MKELIISEIIVFIHDYDISLTENSQCKEPNQCKNYAK